MDLKDFRKVVDVRLVGSVHCTNAVWPHMVEHGYGRILMTPSASGSTATSDSRMTARPSLRSRA